MSPRPWTPKSAISRSHRKIEAAVRALKDVCLEWEDIDQGIVTDAEAQIVALEQFADMIEDTINERLAAGEHVGL